MNKSEMVKLVKRVRDDCGAESYTLIEEAMTRMEDLRKLTTDQHNIMIALRNDVANYVESAITEILIAIKEGAVIESTKKIWKYDYRVAMNFDPCQVCGESRAVQKCHVVPREHKGGWEGNIIYLCPTHHFLFDHRGLSKAEVDKITLENINDHSREYFERVILEDHRMRWDRENLAQDRCIAHCSICQTIPDLLINEADQNGPSGYRASIHCKKCKTCLIRVFGADRESVSLQAIDRWNAGERSAIMGRVFDEWLTCTLYGNTLHVVGVEPSTGTEVCHIMIADRERVNYKYVKIECRSSRVVVIVNMRTVTDHEAYLGKFRIMENEESRVSRWLSVPHTKYKFNQEAEMPEAGAQRLMSFVVEADKNRESYPDGILVAFELTVPDNKEVTSCTLDFTGISESLPRLKCFSADADWL